MRTPRSRRLTYVPADVERYAAHWSTPLPELFERLAEETRSTQPGAEMMVGMLEGGFLSFVVFATKPRLVLDIGTFTGWSSIAMALALPPGASLVSCDINGETTAVARRYAEEAGVADRMCAAHDPRGRHADTTSGVSSAIDASVTSASASASSSGG